MTDEITQFLKNNPGVEYVDVLLPDLCNVIRGKRLGPDSIHKIYDGELQIPSSIELLDITGGCTDAGGRGFSDGDPDVLIFPVEGTLSVVPWGPPGAAQVMGSLYELDHSPCSVDPRHVLDSVVRKFNELGLHPVVAVELEFYLIDAESAQSHKPRPPVLPDSGRRASATQVYSLSDLDGVNQFLREVKDACKTQNVPVGAATAEYAIGQYEINLQHVDNPVLAADHAILLQRAIRGVARQHKTVATFMSKPYPEDAGSGMHIHLSLLDESGRNIFDDGTATGAEVLRQAVAGMLRLIAESMAIFSPNVNSYRRFVPNLYVPTSATWGYNNRSVAVRIPAGGNSSKRIEHRVAGADANPYLVIAAVLAGAHFGITHCLKAPPPRNDNAGAALESGIPFTWQVALDQLDVESTLAEYLTPEYVALYKDCKQYELTEFFRHFTSLEYEWYLAPE